jgi:hypothetical protein
MYGRLSPVLMIALARGGAYASAGAIDTQPCAAHRARYVRHTCKHVRHEVAAGCTARMARSPVLADMESPLLCVAE